jgi:transcriptional/translational regulatory protein YebC/TACO1
VDENRATDAAIELGAEDVRTEGDTLLVVTEPPEFERVRDGLKKAGLPDPGSAEVTLNAQNTVRLGPKDSEAVLKLVDVLEDHDDIQNVYSNFEVDESQVGSAG